MSVTKGSSRIRLETGGIFTTNQNNNVDIELQGGRWIQSGSYAQTDFFGAGVNTLASIFELSTASNFRFFTYPVSVLLSGGTLSCGNNDLDVDGDLTIGSGVTLNGTATNNPTHNIAGSINVAGGTFNLATAGGSPSFTISGSINLISGTVQHSGTGTATITFGATSGTDTLGMSTGTFRVNINCAASQTSVISAGTITHSAGTFSTGNSSTVQLGSSQFSGAAALTVGTSVTLETAHADGFDNGASGCLNYSGTVTLPASTTFRYVGSSAQSTGLSGYGTLTNTVSNIVVATTGSTTVTLDKTLTISGNLTVNTGQTLSYASQTLTLTGSLTLNGTLSDNATSLLVLNNGVSNTFPNGLTALSGGLTLNGALTSLALNASSLSIGAAFTFTNGTFDISGKSLTLNGAITLTAGTLTTSSTTDISIGGSGTLTLGAVATPANLNNLTVNRTGLNLILSQNLTIAGSATITAGTLTYSSRTLTIQNGLSGAGVIADNSTSTLTISNAPSVTIPTGTTTLNGALSISGTSAAVGIGASSLTVSGTFTMSAGSFDIASKTLNLNGILNLTGGSLATNGSTTLAIGGSGTTTWTGVTFPSVIGTLNLNRSGFTLNLASNLTVNTALSIATGNTFVYSGYTLTINGTFTLNGTLTENASSILVISTGGSITLPNAITSLNGGLTISGALTNLSLSSSSLTVSSGFTITGGIFTISTRTINLNGAITLSGGTITGNASTTLNIGGSGTISGSSTALSTLGTLSINRAGQTWNMGGALTVSASTTITAGSLNLNGNTLTLTGDISFGATGITSTNTASAISISGTGTFTGTLGDIALNTLGFNRSGATLNQNGRMRLAGNYTLTAGTHNCSGTANTIEFGSGATSSGTFSAANSNISILGTGTFGISLGAITLNKLRINRASFTLSTSGNTTISDSLKVENGTFAVAAGHTLTLSGPVNVVGTLSFNSTSSLTIDGSGAIIGLSLPTTLSGYTINRSTASITQTGNLTLTGTIAFTSGTHNIGANTLIIQGNVTFGSGVLNSLSTSNITLSSSGTITGSINITAVNNLTMNRTSRTLTLGSDLDVSGTLTLTNGTFDISNRTLTLNGIFNDAGGNFTANSSTNLTIGGSGAIDDFNDFTALNNLTMNRASTTANFPTTLTISGTLTLSNGTVECDDLTLNGPWTITSGSLLIDASKSLTIGGSGALPSTWSNGSDIDNLTINRAGATLVTSNSLTVSGTYTVSAGTHSYVGTNLSLNGPISFSGGAYDGGTTGSIVINGSGTITGSAQFRRIFNFSLMRPSATISLTGLNIISGGFSSSSGTTINMNNTTARFSGNITVSGTWNITSNTSLLVDGTGVITGFPNGFTTIDSLRFNRSTFTHTPSVDFTVNGAFELNAGTIDLTTRALTLNGPITYSGGTLVTNSFSNISIGGSGTISGFPSFSNINTININRSGQTINLASNLNVDAGLTTTAGFINSGTYTITLSNTA
ncbi:beta strand repeat-containing protein, partial [Umezakia ovalisporum]|uniref:beta strand repeat-containing protein n=1 Tax=Umezakia ovalisporum TaxID=75695 RepID=UPI0039C6FBFA